MQAGEKEAFYKPVAQKNGPGGHHQGRYCRYHRMAGHDIDSCRELKEEVESLIRRGQLQEFVAKPKEVDRPQPQ